MTPSADRGIAPVVGVVLLIAITTVVAGAMAAGLSGADALSRLRTVPSTVLIEASANATADRVTLVHRGGDPLDVAELRVHVTVDGEALAHQPPVPFFAAEGFAAGPTGPFNVAGNDRWTAGEAASFEIARTNTPLLESGAEVTVRIYRDGLKVATARATA